MKFAKVLAVALAASVVGAPGDYLAGTEAPDGTVHVPAFDLPPSALSSDEARAALKHQAQEPPHKGCPAKDAKDATPGPSCYLPRMQGIKELFAKTAPAFVARMRDRYAVSIEPAVLGRVRTEIITPAEGVSAAHQPEVLINLHAGAFAWGARWGGEIESIPIAAVGKYKVVSVDYRLAPEYQFPAASEDVEAVYRALLKDYKPQNIGIYGCSAGGLLTAQVAAWLQWKGLPRPGAIAMLCGAGTFWGEGDSGYVDAAQKGVTPDVVDPHKNPYLQDVDLNDPLAFPARSPGTLAGFPPSLLITATRDVALSSVVYTHSRLVAQGVEAELHVWEGLGHGFMGDFNLPESREVYDVVTRFFDRHLGRSVRAPSVAPNALLERNLKDEVDRFVKNDAASPPARCQILFVGSSSIVKWRSLEKDMAPLPAINRGFGGAQIEYVNRWFDQIVAPYPSRAIVFYAGENDIAAGKPVDRVIADFDEFMTMKTAVLGQEPVYFISIKPSKLRWWQFNLQKQVNDAIRARATQRADLHYVDVVPLMLENGKPRDLFATDHLHMTPQGYEIWTQAVKEVLEPDAAVTASGCH